MTNAHRIHLKGPWEYRWIAGTEPASPEHSGRVKMPCDWQSIFDQRAGTVRFARRFHKPTGLEPGDTVWLLFDGIGGEISLWLNGEPLAMNTPPVSAIHSPALATEITNRLGPSNEIALEVTFDPLLSKERGGLWGPVSVVIVNG